MANIAVNLNKYRLSAFHFVLFLTFAGFFSCSGKKLYVDRIDAGQSKITPALANVSSVDSFIAPYRLKIDTDLSTVLAYAPATLDKFQGTWQTPIGNMMADEMLKKGRKLFHEATGKTADICLLNHGGIRAPISKGNVSKRTAFEVMPFENSLIVISLKAAQITEIADYIVSEKKPHPLAGMTFTIMSDKAADIRVGGEPLNTDRIYTVITSDYLANGGDNMIFFRKGVGSYDLKYKIRDALIDYFTETDTVTASGDIRIRT